MADRVRKVSYCYLTIPNRKGQGARILAALRDADVNLIAMQGFPTAGGKKQLDLVAPSVGPIRRIAKRNGWRVSSSKRAFLIQGGDEPGAVYKHVKRLGDAGVNITAAAGTAAGAGRYGMMVWVKPRDFARAARALRAK